MENRERYEFIVLRRGPPFPENFHFSLSAFELSRKAMLKEKQRKKQGKESYISICNNEVSKLGAHSTTQEITKPTDDTFIKKFCTDIILVAAHEIDQEEEADSKNKQTMAKQNDELDVVADRGDGYLPTKDTMLVYCTREHGIPDQNLPSKCYSEANIHEVARNICQEAIYKALTIVAKENLEHIQGADCYHDNIATASDSKNEEFLPKADPAVNATQLPKEALDKPEERQNKKVSKAELKEQKKHQRFQEKKAIAYIKMVNEKYKKRNDTINKLLKDQAKEEKKRKEKEKKLQKHAQKVEEKEQKKKEKETKKEMAKTAKLEERRKNNSHDEQTTNAEGDLNQNKMGGQTQNEKRQRLSFSERIREMFGCFFH